MMRLILVALLLVGGSSTAVFAATENWPQWRGPQGTGVAPAGDYPVKFSSTEGVAWKAPLPGIGTSTPVVWGSRIFLTCGIKDDKQVRDGVLCFGMNGSELWRHQFGPERRGKNPHASGSNPSPVTDGVLVYGSTGQQRPYLMVVNASNREKIVAWVKNRLYPDLGCFDLTLPSAMIAVQGPLAIETLQKFVQADSTISNLRYYTCMEALFDGLRVSLSRTGYTGEDGFEIICNAKFATRIWETIIDAIQSIGGRPAGLGARDTLRLEAAMPLYGHELSETINPIQAGLNFAVNLTGRKFIGSEAIEKFAADKSQPVRIGLQCDGKRVPRQGCPVLHNDVVVGEVTSGTYSPTLDRPIAMAYVQPVASAIGTHLTTDIRGIHHPAVVVPLPFYKRPEEN